MCRYLETPPQSLLPPRPSSSPPLLRPLFRLLVLFPSGLLTVYCLFIVILCWVFFLYLSRLSLLPIFCLLTYCFHFPLPHLVMVFTPQLFSLPAPLASHPTHPASQTFVLYSFPSILSFSLLFLFPRSCSDFCFYFHIHSIAPSPTHRSSLLICNPLIVSYCFL